MGGDYDKYGRRGTNTRQLTTRGVGMRESERENCDLRDKTDEITDTRGGAGGWYTNDDGDGDGTG